MAPSSSSPNLLLRASSSSPNLLLRASSSSPSRSSTAVVGSSPSEILPAMADSSSSPSRIRRAIAGSSSRSRISPATATTSYSQSMDQDASISRPPVIPASPNSSQGSDALYMDITVSDPVKRGHAFSLHTSYTVITRTNMPSYETERLVHRRYSDFQWLHNKISEEYNGIQIPRLPEKNILEKWLTSTVPRMKGLNQFLRTIASDNILRQSSCLKKFLQDESIDNDGLLKHMLVKSFDNIKSTFGEIFSEQFAEKEKDLMDLQRHVSMLMGHLKQCQKNTHVLLQKKRDTAMCTVQCADALRQLGKAEDKASFYELGKTFEFVSKILEQELHNMETLERFLTSACICDLISIEIFFRDYEKASQRVLNLNETIRRKTQHRDEDAMTAEILKAAREEVAELEAIASKSKEECDDIASSIKREMLIYFNKRENDVGLAITEFAKRQGELAMKGSRIWSELTDMLARPSQKKLLKLQ